LYYYKDEEINEELIEMLVLEGFGKIVEMPSHEKIAVILADRARLIEELNQISTELDTVKKEAKLDSGSHAQYASTNSLTPSTSTDKNSSNDEASTLLLSTVQSEKARLTEKIDMLVVEIELLKSANAKLSSNWKEFRDQYEHLNAQNNGNLEQVRQLNAEIEELKAEQDKLNKTCMDDTSSLAIESAQMENVKLKEDNFNLKEEIDKLYEEIGRFEVESKQLKDENKSRLSEVTTLKKEIEDLNNELDELLQFKANYDRLKKDYDKLSASLKLHDQLLNEKLASPRVGSQTPASLLSSSSSFLNSKKSEENKSHSNPQLELDWIRGENEKLLLDLEKAQNKFNDKIGQYARLKEQLEVKDEEMKSFIEKYEHKQTSQDDVLSLQKKILELEHELDSESEERQKELEQNQERHDDLLKRNDQLWLKLSNAEQSYAEVVKIVEQQGKANEALEMKKIELTRQIALLEDDKVSEMAAKENLIEEKQSLESELDEFKLELEDLNKKYAILIEEKFNDNAANEAAIVSLTTKITGLTEELRNREASLQTMRMDVESLNKEKAFIISQNESTQSKVLHDLMSLQEKFADVNFRFDKASKENAKFEALLKEKTEALEISDSERKDLIISLKKESIEKTEAVEKLNQLDALLIKVRNSTVLSLT
jgi:chromosome segregation ATPase